MLGAVNKAVMMKQRDNQMKTYVLVITGRSGWYAVYTAECRNSIRTRGRSPRVLIEFLHEAV